MMLFSLTLEEGFSTLVDCFLMIEYLNVLGYLDHSQSISLLIFYLAYFSLAPSVYLSLHCFEIFVSDEDYLCDIIVDTCDLIGWGQDQTKAFYPPPQLLEWLVAYAFGYLHNQTLLFLQGTSVKVKDIVGVILRH